MPDESLYRQLQQALDRMPVGFPSAPSGVDLRILRQLFTPEEARAATALGLLPQSVEAIHGHLGAQPSLPLLEEMLRSMDHRGLIRSSGRRYALMPFVVGIYEGQVNRMTPELARDLLQYFDEALHHAIAPKATPQLRTVPVNRTIGIDRYVAPYDDIRRAVAASPGPFAVMNCICRQTNDLSGHPCRQTRVRENCLILGPAAVTMMEHGQARQISRQRMLELLDEADREGLVLEPQNTRDPMFICCCCGCCCVSLNAAKTLKRPADYFHPNYYAEIDPNSCTSCMACQPRCQMDAIVAGHGVTIDRARCIGCGLCLSVCPSGALKLTPVTQQVEPPGSTQTLYAKIYRERFGALRLAAQAVRLLRR
jgi:ferredoxin